MINRFSFVWVAGGQVKQRTAGRQVNWGREEEDIGRETEEGMIRGITGSDLGERLQGAETDS